MSDTKLSINDLKNASAHISSMALTSSWSSVFKKYALAPDEELTDDPGASFNVFLHLTAFGAAKSIYEQEARINEANESTAILPKSLLNKLSTSELEGLFGLPASTTIAFCISEEDIINKSLLVNAANTSADSLRRLIINKEMEITFESHPTFRLPYDVNINCKPIISITSNPDTGEEITTIENNIYATYDLPISSAEGLKSIYGIYNNNISSRKMKYEGKTYIAFFLKIYQIARKTVSFYVNDPYLADSCIDFSNNLVGFEVYKKTSGSSTWTLMGPGQPEGNIVSSSLGYNYSYDYKRNSQNFNVYFNKTEGVNNLSSGDQVKITIYTTQGSVGNIKFPYMIYNLNKLIINYNQDLTNPKENKMLDLVALAFARDESAIGGRNQLTHEEIRAKIIDKKYSRNILITDNEIKNAAKKLGLDAYKAQSDIIAIYYRGVDKLTYNDMILSTGTNTFNFDLSSISKLSNAANTYLIKPTDVFSWNSEKQQFEYSSDVETYEEYVTKYNATSNIEAILEAVFPFYIQYKNTENPSALVYDMNLNLNEYAEFTKYSEDNSLDKLDISYVKVQRNPYKTGILSTPESDPANTYYITFIVYTGENTLTKLSNQVGTYVNSEILTDYENQYVKFHITMVGAGNGNEYLLNPTKLKITNGDTMVSDGFIAYQATLVTDNYVSSDKKISLKNIKNRNTMSNDYSIYNMVDTTVGFIIEGAFTDCNIVGSYTNFSSVYELNDIKLVDYIATFGIDFDIKTKLPTYIKWKENIPERYSNIVYEKNVNYDPTITDSTDINKYPYVIETDNNNDPIFIIPDNQSNIHTPKYKVSHSVNDIVYIYKCTNGYGVEEEILEDDATAEQIASSSKTVKYLHKTGEYKYYTKTSSGSYKLFTGSNTEAINNSNVVRQAEDPEYTGVLKNVPWIDRIYFGNGDIFETIRDLYINLIDRVQEIKNLLYDGGEIYASLKRTSGPSKKYKAYLLSSDSTEYINNVALTFVYRVKFLDSLTIESKKQLIIDATVEYINNLGDSSLSIDGLFEYVKEMCPNIEYINITKINDYKNGEVQTILNDTSVTNEVMTVSQKIQIDDNGDIQLEPDITVNVVNN